MFSVKIGGYSSAQELIFEQVPFIDISLFHHVITVIQAAVNRVVPIDTCKNKLNISPLHHI